MSSSLQNSFSSASARRGDSVAGAARGWRGARLRILAATTALPLLLSACAATHTNDPTLTPAQNQLRQANAGWNQTVAAGAALGAASGAAIGAMSSNNRGQGALIGAVAGLIIGGLAATEVANRNFGFANREIGAQARVENANTVAADLERRAQLADQVVAQNRTKLADLDRRYRAGQITAAQYNQQVAPIREDVDQLKKSAQQGREARDAINQERDLPQLRAAENRIRPAQRKLEASAAELEDMLTRVPAV
jgi:hypothetical protein